MRRLSGLLSIIRDELVLRPVPFVPEYAAECDALRVVDVENRHGGAAGLCAADEYSPAPLEVAFPRLAPRVEKPDHVAREWVAAAQIRPLVQMAAVATPAPIVEVVGAAVLPGDYMFDVKRGRRSGEVGKAAVLIPPAGPFADKLTKKPCHQASAACLRIARALA
jgi:hypothetical protein